MIRREKYILKKRKKQTRRRLISACAALLAFIVIIILCVKSCDREQEDVKLETTLADIIYVLPESTAEQSTTASETEEQTEPETVPESTTVEPAQVSLIAYGDNLIHIDFSRRAMETYGDYVFNSLYRNIIQDVKTADVAIVNQEVPVAAPELEISNYPRFNAPSTIVDALFDTGFDVMTMATNHTLDQGAQGLKISLNYIHDNFPEILTTGAYLTEAERNIIPIREVNGIRIAFLNYTYGSNCGWSSSVYVNRMTEELMSLDIELAKAQADYIVVCMHWGEENQLLANYEQMSTAAFLCEAGVDLIIGTHPHVVQQVNMVTSTTGHQTLIYYSLGNLISMQNTTESMLGGVAKVNIVRDPDGTVRTDSYDYDFVVTQWGFNYSDPHVIPWSAYSEELAGEHNMPSYDNTFSYARLQKIIDNVRYYSD